jgi:hypothetical protein
VNQNQGRRIAWACIDVGEFLAVAQNDGGFPRIELIELRRGQGCLRPGGDRQQP